MKQNHNIGNVSGDSKKLISPHSFPAFITNIWRKSADKHGKYAISQAIKE